MKIDKDWYDQNNGREFVYRCSDTKYMRTFDGTIATIFYSRDHSNNNNAGIVTAHFDEWKRIYGKYQPEDCHSITFNEVDFNIGSPVTEPSEDIYNDLI